MTIYELYNSMSKEDVNNLVEYVCRKHHYVKNQDFELASEYRDMERNIYIKWGISTNDSLWNRLVSIYGNDLDYIKTIRDMKINDILQ